MTERPVVLDDGARTTLQTWGERGPLLLCVHGMTSSRRSWERLGKAFQGEYRVAAYDQRGHGDSASVTGPMSLERAERDLQNVASALGEPVATYIGHSWGGAVVVRGGLHASVPRVVAIDPMIRQVDDAWYGEYVAELRETFAATGDERDAKTREEFATWSHDDVEGKVHAVHTMTTAPIEGLQRDNPAASWDLRPVLAAYDKPLLLAIPGREDGINDAEMIDDVVAHAPGQMKVAWFHGQGHNLHRTDFDAFLVQLRDFLA